VQYIQQLQENEASNIDKWTLEKLLTEQAISELSATVDKQLKKLDDLERELETWKQAAIAAGISSPKEASPLGNGTNTGPSNKGS
jgi:hypothetical protein